MIAPSVFDATAVRSQGHHRTAALNANSARIAANCVTVKDSLDNSQFIAVNNILAQRGFSVQCKMNKQGAGSSPHPVVNAFKAVAMAAIAHNTRHSAVKNVGASTKQIMDLRNAHCCQITLDGRQEARNQATIYQAARMLANHNLGKAKSEHAKSLISFFVSGKRYVRICDRGVQNCFFQCYNLVGIDSIYDITPEELEVAFVRSGARIGYFTMLAPPEIEVGCTSGSCGEINWKTYTRNGRDLEMFETPKQGHRVAFAFGDSEGFRCDGSAGYEHDAYNYWRWVKMGAYHGRELNYYIERDYYGPVAVLTIRACKRSVTVPKMKGLGYSRTLFPDVESLLAVIGEGQHGSRGRYHDISTAFYEKIMSYAMSRDQKVWNFANFCSYIRANSITVTVAGTEVLGFNRADVNAATRQEVLVSLWFQANLLRRNAMQVEKDLAKVVERIENTGVATSGFFAHLTRLGYFASAVFHSVLTTYLPDSEADHIVTKEMLSQLKTNEHAATFEKLTAGIKARFKAWYTVNSDIALLKNGVRKVHAQLETAYVPNALAQHKYSSDTYVVPVIYTETANEETEQGDARISAYAKTCIEEYRIIIAPKELNNSRKILAHGADAMHEVIAAAAEFVLSHDANFKGAVQAVIGGPGTGKSHHIVKNIEDNDVVLCATSEAKEEFEEKIAHENDQRARQGMAIISGVRVFTPHSLVKYIRDRVAGNSLIKPKNLWSDEAFITHPGLTFMCAGWLDVSTIYIVGDDKQLRHKDFEIGEEEVTTYMRWNNITDFIPRTELFDNYRLPESHVHAINARYGYQMVPKSGRAGMFQLRKFSTVADALKACGKDAYVVTKQNAHVEMARNAHLHAVTTHRAQGATKDHVCFILTTDHLEQFNEDPGYLVVSMTRHRESLSIFLVEGDYATLQLPNESAGCIEAFLDLSVHLAPITMERPVPKLANTIPIADRMGHRPNCLNLDFDVLEQDLLDLGICTNRFGEDMEEINSIVKTNNAAPACVIKIKPNRAIPPPETVRSSRLSAQAIFQHQESNNPVYALYTWCTRNAASRKLPNAAVCVEKVPQLFERMTDFYYQPNKRKHLTAEQLQAGMTRVIRNIQIRGKTPAYRAIIDEMFDIDAVKGFIKEQTKVKTAPDTGDADFYDSLCTAAKNFQESSVLAGKAGQGVAAWSKARNLLMGCWINAIEEVETNTLQPWVLHATGMEDSEICARIEEIMTTYGFCICIKGDDTFVAALVNGEWKYYCSDQSQFDTSFSSVHYTLESCRYASYGMPEHLILHNKEHAMKYNLLDSTGFLQMLNILCGNCSGKPQTLSLNSFVSMCILQNSLSWVTDSQNMPCDFSVRSDLRVATEELFGVKIKVEHGEVASFIGYLIKDGKVVPDLLRTSGKFLSRRVFTNATVPADVKLELIDKGYKKEELSVAKTVSEICIALRDRMKSIDSEGMKAATIDINAHYYFPHRPQGAMRRLERTLAFLQNAASFEHIRFFVKQHLQRVHDFFVIYENN